MIRILGGVIVGIWVARYLGPSDFGILNYSIAYTSLFMLFVNLGLDKIIVRELVKKPRLTDYFLGTAFGLKLAGSIVAIVFVSISLFIIKSGHLTKVVIFIISMNFIFQSFDVIDYFYRAKILSKYVVIARNSAFIISSLIKVYLILNEYGVICFAIANVIDFFLSGMFLVITYKITGNFISKWRLSKRIAKRLIIFCWPLAISMFLVLIHTRIDQVMIGNMLHKEQVGIYSAAVKLAEFWYFIPGIIVNTLMPYFVELRDRNHKLFRFRLVQLYSLMFWMGVAVGFFVLFFSKNIILVLFGVEYVPAYEALIFNIWAGIFIAQAVARGIYLISENIQLFRLINNILAVILNIFLNLYFIPKMGISGAALSSLLSVSISTWIFSFFLRPLRGSTLDMIRSCNPIYLLNRSA